MSREANLRLILQRLLAQSQLSLAEARVIAEGLGLSAEDLLEGACEAAGECRLDRESTALLEAALEQSGIFERARQLALCRRLQHMRERSEAPGLYARLLEHPKAHRHHLLRDPRYQTRALVDLLLAEAREAWHQDIHQAECTTALALELVGCLNVERYGKETLADLEAKVWAFSGNVHRLHYRWQEAALAFERADEHLEQGSGDPLLRALVLDLKATLKGARRDLATALELFKEATAIYTEMGETHLAGRAMVNQANTLKEMSRVDSAIRLLYKALELLDPEQEPHLQLFARHNLMFFLCEVGRAEEAAELLKASRGEYLRHPVASAQLRLRWLEGKIALGVGDLREAEAALKATQEGFVTQGAGAYSALAALDLAAVYAQEHRTADLKSLAGELFATFQSLDIHREAYAAIILFRQAADLEAVTAGVLQKASAMVERSQRLPPDKPS
jgi:tetratricopeptide (TPR) repeat protein